MEVDLTVSSRVLKQGEVLTVNCTVKDMEMVYFFWDFPRKEVLISPSLRLHLSVSPSLRLCPRLPISPSPRLCPVPSLSLWSFADFLLMFRSSNL